MSQSKIDFYKLRDFGEKMNVTVEFMKANFKKIFLTLIFIGGPAAIIMTVLFADIFNGIFSFTENGIDDIVNMLGLDYVMVMLLSWLTITMIIALTYTIIKCYNSGTLNEASIGDVFAEAIGKYAGLVVLSFLIFAVSILGFFLFIIPGIYLSVTLSLAYPIYMLEEDTSVGQAFSKSFAIIGGKWWSTFGVLLIGYMMAYVVQMVFSIPFIFVYIREIFTLIEETPDDPSAIMGMFTSGYMTFAMGLSTIGSYVSYAIPLVALGYQYANLIERKEGKGLMTEIDDFDKTD